MIFLILIILIVMTERSLVDGMMVAGRKTKETTSKLAAEQRQRARERELRREELLAEKEKRLAQEQQMRQLTLDDTKPMTAGNTSSKTPVFRQPEEKPAEKKESSHGFRFLSALKEEKTVQKKEAQTTKKPVLYHDGPVDIPLISHDQYLERKQREQAQAEKQKRAAYQDPYDNALFQTDQPRGFMSTQPGKEKPAANELKTAAVVKTGPVLQAAEPADRSAEPMAEDTFGAPVEASPVTVNTTAQVEEPAETRPFDPDGVSTEKVFSQEEFPDGYTDRQETAKKAGLTDTKMPAEKPVGPTGVYHFPPIDLLKLGPGVESQEVSRDELIESARNLEEVLAIYGVEAKVIQVNRGPAVTRYELQPKLGTSVKKITGLDGDIAMALAVTSIHIEAPIPGKSAVGIEVPNKDTTMVTLREVIDSDVFRKSSSKLTFSLGKDIDGDVRVADIAKMPHMLIAGATGSGKSVCINSLIMSLIYKAHPDDVKMILIDPKVVELQVYNGIPHLLLPVVNDPKQASATLNWAVQEMTRRYKKFAEFNVRDIRGFNDAIERGSLGEDAENERKMPQIVIIIDELADLMMVASKEVETSICRLAQMARAAGMHLVIATQRPSVDVITGLIKANIPSRIAFAVSSGVDSKTILDGVGAEKLLGKGDMLYAPIGASRPVRIQGTFVSDQEVENVVEFVKKNGTGVYDTDLSDMLKSGSAGQETGGIEDEIDEYLEEAVRLVVEKQKASISMMQRAFRIGFNRAARLMDALERRGVVGPDEGSKPRQVLMTKEEWENEVT
ncbi:MAG: DNA translocase FtsK [Firmicutes bacterium]|nr:DNA translocase FtsK [Bacillota bacterium]